MAVVRRSLILAPALVLALSAGGLVSAAAQVPPETPGPGTPGPGTPEPRTPVPGTPASFFPSSGRHAIKEITNLKTVVPFAQRWRDAIARRNVRAAIQAGEDYEAAWQAIEVYINHRSLPLYTDIEIDTQFVIEDGLKASQPDWPRLLRLAEHLRQALGAAIGFIAVQPSLSPLFDDLVPLRGVRAQLLITRDALAAGDVAKARTFFNKFTAGFVPGIEDLIGLRSTAALQETRDALNAAAAKFADPNATAAELTPLVATLLNRFGYGVNLLNAAARAADLHKTTFNDADKTALTQLNDVALGLKRSLPKFPADPAGAAEGGATGPGSAFAKVQPALEAKARLVNTAATLRAALAAYATSVLSTPAPSAAQVAAANKTALEAVALAQQTFVGQFWTDPALQAFLNGLPHS